MGDAASAKRALLEAKKNAPSDEKVAEMLKKVSKTCGTHVLEFWLPFRSRLTATENGIRDGPSSNAVRTAPNSEKSNLKDQNVITVAVHLPIFLR